jgi:DNA-binding response OmpR family regulator
MNARWMQALSWEPRPDAAPASALGPLTVVPPPPPETRCGDLEIDRAARRASVAGRELRLTAREYELLICLLDRKNRVVTRADLLERIWDLPDDYGSNVADVYVRRLRYKMGERAAMIETVRGIGYCLRPPRDA